MKKLTALLTASLILLCCGLRAQNTDDASMKAWQAYMTPGEVHKMLAKDDGQWTYEMTAWMAPDAPPSKSTGTCVNKMILGGRYQQSTYKGTFMGQPFEGIATTAYDNGKKTFYSTWIDNMGTGIMWQEGQWDDASKTLTMMGKSYDPMKGKDCQSKSVMKWPDVNTQVMEMYMVMDDGKEFKTMELKAKRK
ncbi:DUF1579 domain-containing protein [Solitalea sp. MAHUQ-68]|uniref:DUF1579 domain-containing protein n=1 Tax=Solitalea agri TaxID=2953739 RepID=A0A9X2EZI2_9SPHI|nr:DUF1579 domain-containing protein [Solitalea agri]MCO4291822.1 DUF1579 domain-containing protein [Solitalea agri]